MCRLPGVGGQEDRLAILDTVDNWERELGPVSDAVVAEARATFDEIDGTAED